MFRQIQDNCYNIFEAKQKDYGGAFEDTGVVGVLIRLLDKIRRGISVSNNSINVVKDETLKDTLLDLANYAVMGVLLMEDEEREKQDKVSGM